jgi:hypothetical protein
MRPEEDLSPAANVVAAKLFTAAGGDWRERPLAVGGITSEHISATAAEDTRSGHVVIALISLDRLPRPRIPVDVLAE